MNNQPVDYVTVDEYLDSVNSALGDLSARVIGEVTEVQLYEGRTYLFFKIKDKECEAVLTCMMWRRDYVLSGVQLEQGLEVVISGAPSVYKPYGRLSFQAKTVELVGEGQLKKAYDELKTRLEKEGLFRDDRKRALPTLPQRIGLITSKDGAAIGDFQVNLGKFGFKVALIDSRVEGQLAVADLMSAIQTFKKKDVEVLVLVRGGGSLESLLSFNNEALVREVVNFPVPVLVGVGHEKDISLVALAADQMVSTPTAAAQALNVSWQQLATDLQQGQQKIFTRFERAVTAQKLKVEQSFQRMRRHLEAIFEDFRQAETGLLKITSAIQARITELHRAIDRYPLEASRGMRGLLQRTQTHMASMLTSSLADLERAIFTLGGRFQIDAAMAALSQAINSHRLSAESLEKLLASNNPERQLKLGYSIVRSENSLIRGVSQIRVGQTVQIRVQDGTFDSDITVINKGV